MARAPRGTGAQREVPRPGAPAARSASAAQGSAKPTGSQRKAVSAPARVEPSEVEPAPPRERTRIYRTVEPPRTVVEARAAELARVEAARASQPVAVVAAPARVTDGESAARGKAARAAERAEAARVAEQAAAERARARAPRTPTGPRAPATEVVDVLQPASPWAPSADEPRPRGSRKRREPDAAAPALVSATAASSASASATPAPSEPKEARKRRASFGEHVLNRLR
jgi:hypothetical protein